MVPSNLTPNGGIVYNIVFTTLASLFVLARIYARYLLHPRGRWRSSKAYIISDASLVFALLITIAFATLDTWLRSFGKGKLRTTGAGDSVVPMDWFAIVEYIETSIKLTFPLQVLGVVQLLAVKVSFIALYYEVAEDLSWRARQLLHVAAFCIVSICGVAVLVYLFSRCTPLHRYWSMGTDNCFTAYPVEYNAVMTTSDIFTDLCIICMGWVVITQSLSFSRNNRGIISGATFVTVLGLFTIACSCVRAAVSVGMSKAVQKGVLVSGKESYDLAEWLVVVGLAEFNTALIAASLPTLRVIWRKYRDGRKRGTKRSEEGSFGSGSSRLGDEEMGPKESDGTAMPTSLVFMTEPEKNLRSVDSTMSMEFERMVAVVEKKAWSNVLERDDSRRATPGTEMEVQMREHGLMGQVKPPRIHR